MTRIPLSRFTLAALALPLALAACKGHSNAPGAAPSGAPVAKVAAPAGKAWSDEVEVTKDGGYRMGNPQAPIRMVEYGSLSCPHCAHLAEQGFQKLVSDYVDSGRVSYEYRSFAIHSIDIPLTVLVRCADKSAFFGLVDQLYTNQKEIMDSVAAPDAQAKADAAMKLPPNQRFGALADSLGFTAFFAKRGISTDQAHACLANTKTAQEVADFSDATSKAGIDSTPTVIINDQRIAGTTWPEVEAALQGAGAR